MSGVSLKLPNGSRVYSCIDVVATEHKDGEIILVFGGGARVPTGIPSTQERETLAETFQLYELAL